MEDKMLMLLCVDGSENSDRAAQFLARIASSARMTVTVLHVVPQKEAIEHLDDNQELRRENLEHKLRYAIDQMKEADADHIELIQIGDPAEVIVEMSNKYDGIVMGYKGHGFIETLFMGSVTERVMRESKRPVILVP